MKKYLAILIILLLFSKSYGYSFCLQPLNFSLKEGLYAGAMGGYSGGFDLKCRDVSTNLGYYVGGKIGKNFSPLLSLEEELIFQSSNMRAIKEGKFQLEHVHGYFNIWSFMTNALLNFNCDFPLRPYIGGGIGYAHADAHWCGSLIEVGPIETSFKRHIKANCNKGGFAWQVIVGLKFLTCLNWEVDLECRYLKLSDHVNNYKLGLALINFF